MSETDGLRQVAQYSVLEMAVMFDSNCLHVALVQSVLIVLPCMLLWFNLF